MRIFLYISLSIILVACNPAKIFFGSDEVRDAKQKERMYRKANRKYDKLIKKYPFLVEDSTTVTTTVPVRVDTFEIHDTIYGSQNTDRLEHIIDSLLDLDYIPDSVIKEVIRTHVINRNCIEDTVQRDTSFVIFVNNEPFKVDISIGIAPLAQNKYDLYAKLPPDQNIDIDTEVKVPQPGPKQLPWYDRVILWVNKWLKWLIIGFVAAVVIRIFWKSIRRAIKLYIGI